MKLKVCFAISILVLAMIAGIAAADVPPLKYKDPDYQGQPAIYENRVVWHDYHNGSMDIYMYDLATGI
ncbi:hypothetical protein LI82_06280 [Methanococcoides methylutens]|uniref:Uncharacterized protein n=1 Tax=Methanococcoides methylutens TaxID=2226 RepID=A0A099T1T6_METMT|nr:hypothetical protein [Methanococcoides methylutens]KGK98894.1 hypothetical protein LI82_06280 [Methanococcoides methylutens]